MKNKTVFTNMEDFNIPMQIISFLPYTIYFLAVFSKQLKGDIKWSTRIFLLYILNAVCSMMLFTLQYRMVAGIITVGGLYLHWTYLPQQHVNITNKAILVTGCDRGIGHELAKKLDSVGFQVFAGCLCKGGKGEEELKAACSDRLVTLQMDVKNAQQVDQAAKDVEKKLGNNKLWAIVNNAGICYIGNIEIMSIDDIEKVMAINYMGPIHVCRAFLPLVRRSQGRVINVASNAGLAPVPHMGVYCASKAALATLSESLRYELDQWGVKVTTIVPSGYKTGILAYDKIATAEKWWKSASDTVKEDFGKECFIPKFKYSNHESNTTPDLRSIVNTIETALLVKCPQSFYYSGFLARTLPFVYLYSPVMVRDPLMKVLGHWFNFDPKGLNEDENKNPQKRHITKK